MLKKKKDAELSITVIIVAILGLIVLVVMVYIFGEGTSDAVTTLKTCAAKGGVCKTLDENVNPPVRCDGRIIDGVELGCTGEMVCCIDI
jgi:flagellar basal body-associated protein FliL